MGKNWLAYALHTKSSYAEQLGELYSSSKQNLFTNMKNGQSFEQQIANLEAKEATYYAAVGANNYHDFRKKIQSVISSEVAWGLSQLGGAQLRKNLEELKMQHMDETLSTAQEYEIIIDVYGLQQANSGINKILEDIKNNLSTEEARVTRQKGGKLKVQLKPDPAVIKKIINSLGEVIKNEETGKSSKKRGRKFKEDRTISPALIKKLNQLQLNNILQFGAEGSEKTQFFSEVFSTEKKYLGYPWNFRKGDIELAELQNDQDAFRQRLIQALRDIKSWLIIQIGPDPDLRQSLIEEWGKVIGEKEGELTNASFFLKGGYIELVVGALGEFQTAVFQNYLGRKFPTMRATFSASIQGNVFAEGTSEQAKADIMFGKLGIQVKNYSSTQSRIEGNIHPYELSTYYDQSSLFESGFFGLLANRFWIEFNGPGLNDLAADLNEALAAILNFDVLEQELTDKISFYMISGCYLVPASVILKHYSEIQKDNKIFTSITSKQVPKSEKEFKIEEYWEASDSSFTPTEKNQKTFDNLLSHGISLRANFNYGNIPNLENYRLW